MSIDVLEISAQNFELTDALKEHCVSKMNKVLTHDNSITKLDLLLKEEKHNDKKGTMQANAKLSFHKHHIHLSVKSEDMYHSVTELTTNLLREIRKEHRNFVHKRKHP